MKVQSTAISCDISEDNMSLTLTFGDGRALRIEDVTRLSQTIINMATLHGLKQKLVDAAAIGRDPTTGRSATLDDKYNAVKEVFERIVSADGTWNKIRAAGEAPTGGLFVRAMMKLSGKTKDEIAAQLEKLNKEQLSALRANKRVVEMMATLREPDATADSLLDDIIGG